MARYRCKKFLDKFFLTKSTQKWTLKIIAAVGPSLNVETMNNNVFLLLIILQSAFFTQKTTYAEVMRVCQLGTSF